MRKRECMGGQVCQKGRSLAEYGASIGTPRFAFVDVLRLMAACQMIVGHTLDALLADAYRHGRGFGVWTFCRGLTSTAFFLAAGLSFALSTRAQAPHAGRRRRVLRAIELVAVGFLLRAPLGVAWGERWDEAMARTLQPDVLHCMAAALLACEAIFAVSGSARRALIGGGAGLLCLWAAAPVDAWARSRGCQGVAVWLGPRCGAPFPLLPWLGYPLYGLGVGAFCFAKPRRSGPIFASVPGRLLIAAVATLLLSVSWRGGAPPFSPQIAPSFALLRLGLVLLLSALIAVLVPTRPLHRHPQKLASETLFLYATHVVLLYAGHVGLSTWIGHRLALWSALLVAFALGAICALGALSYGRLLPALRGGRGGGTPAPQRRPSHPG
jgi:uncharacterized membrane protein